MALILGSATCAHCGNTISKRRYAAPYSSDEHARTFGVDLWVSGSGAFPGDQRICESHVLPDDIGSFGFHEPA